MRPTHRLWLSRQYDGKYLMTGLRPTLHEVGHAGFKAFYLVPGDPIGVTNLCSEVIHRWVLEIPVLTSVQIDLTMNLLPILSEETTP